MAVICQNCGRELDARTSFCPYCGQRVPRFKDAQFDGLQVDRFCPRCGQPVADGVTTCPHCGTDLSALDDASWAAAVANAELGASVTYLSDLDESSRVVDRTQVIQAPLSAQSQMHVHERQTRRTSNDNWRTAVVGVLVVVALGFVAVLGVRTRGFGLLDWYDKPTGLPGAPEAPATTVVEPGTADATDAADSQTDTSPEVELPSSVPQRGGLDQYSWAELAAISKELQNYAREDALAALVQYHLINEDGSMPATTKGVSCGEYGTAQVRLADVFHDDLVGGGKATFTFVCANLPALHEVNSTNANEGGWRQSEVRTWLNAGVYAEMPDDLRAVIAAVYKATNNVGNTADEASVTDTEDVLWLLSTVEVGGPISYYWGSDPSNSQHYNNIINAEGSQYACFASVVSNNESSNSGLSLTYHDAATSWWLRSTSPSKTYNFRHVSASGDPSNYDDATKRLGICFGFCI